jgi:capsule polysaccharide export protein KpsE/RkpR
MAAMMDDRFDLKRIYGTDSYNKMKRKLGERTFINIRDEGVVEIAVEAPEAELARDMVAAYIEFTDSILIDLNIQNAESKIEYLEKELGRLERESAKRDSLISAFMTSSGVFEVEQQARAAIEVISALKARISMLEVERNVMSIDMREGSTDLQRIDLEIENLKEEVKRAVEDEDVNGIFPPLSQIPGLAATYLGMVSERMAGEFSMAYIRLKLEDARISTSLNLSILRVIDPPVVPERRSWPKRKQIVIILTLATVFWTCFVITLKEKLYSDEFAARRAEDSVR